MNTEETGQWGIVELMGHKVVAGFIQKSEMLGKPMLRVDVPETSGYQAFTQFYGDSAIYCVTFTSEEVARLTAEQTAVNPVSVYVPDLITAQKHEEVTEMLKERIRELHRRLDNNMSLPKPEFTDVEEDPDEDEL